MDIQQQSELLRDISLFATLTEPQLKLLAFTCEVMQYKDQELLCRQNEEPDAVYVILSGRVHVQEVTGDSPLVLAGKEKGDLVGEMAVLRGERRSASVVAIGSVEALRIPNERFVELITSNEKLARYVMRDLATKLAQSNEKISRQRDNPAI